MKKIEVNHFKKSLAIYIFVAMASLFTLLVISTYIAQKKYNNHELESYNRQISFAMKHIMKRVTLNYRHRVDEILRSVDIVSYVKNGDREGLYKILKKKYDLIGKETSNLQVMQVHFSNGHSFLRVHEPTYYGDNIALRRAMLQEIHKNHKELRGYETGKYAIVYRIIEPLFDANHTYVGAFEIGLNLQFWIDAVKEINGFDGMVFIKDEKLKLYSIKSDIVMGAYRLQSEYTPELKKLYDIYASKGNFLDDEVIIFNGERYIVHCIRIYDFEGQESAKLLFFQKIVVDTLFFKYVQYVLYTFMFALFALFLWLIYRRIEEYQKNIDEVYDAQLHALDISQRHLRAIFDATPNIMISTTGGDIDKANPAMLKFFNFTNLQSFKNEHQCICDFFLESDNFLTAEVNTQTWLEYILERPFELHKVCMLKENKKHYFTVHAKSLEFDELRRSIVVFNDITKVYESEKIYLDFFEHTKSANIIYGTVDNAESFSVKSLNAKVEEIEKVRKEELVGKSVNEVFEGASEFGILEVFKEVYATGKAQHLPLSLYEKKTLTGYRDIYVFKLENGDIVASYEDKTQEKRLEQELLVSQHQFELFMHYIPAIIFIKDSKGKIVYANDKMMNLYSTNPIGLGADELLSQEDAQNAKKVDALILENGQIDQVNIFEDQSGGKRAYRTLGFVIKEALEDKIALVMIDVTKEYLTQKEIIRLKSAIDTSSISVMMTDKDGHIEYVNPNYEKMSGYTQEELLGRNPRIVKSGETSDVEYKKMWGEISHGRVWSSEIKNIAKDGSSFWENSTIVPSFDENGEVDGYIALKLEITEQMALRAELHDKDEIMIAQSRHAAMGEMISMIAHQWRQPISVIAMDANNILVDIALENLQEDALREDLEDIVQQTEHLSKTIDDFRDYFKPNKLKNHVLVSEVLLEALSVIGKSLENNNIEVLNTFDSETEISIFSRELLQVFLNIFKNAKEALVENRSLHRKIVTRIYEIQESVVTEISDNGGGIKDDILEKIFEPYFTTKDEKNGTGLGLYMSKIIVEKHLQGSLKVANSEDGVCFRLELPFESGD